MDNLCSWRTNKHRVNPPCTTRLQKSHKAPDCFGTNCNPPFFCQLQSYVFHPTLFFCSFHVARPPHPCLLILFLCFCWYIFVSAVFEASVCRQTMADINIQRGRVFHRNGAGNHDMVLLLLLLLLSCCCCCCCSRRQCCDGGSFFVLNVVALDYCWMECET